MIKLYLKNIKIVDVLVALLPIVVAPFIMGVGSGFLESIKYAHYVTLVPNIILLIFCYKQHSKINTMYSIITTRLGSVKVFVSALLFGAFMAIVYSCALYGYLAIFLTLPLEKYWSMCALFLLLNSFVYLIEQQVMAFQIGNKKNLIYILIPIVINVVFHYYAVPVFFS